VLLYLPVSWEDEPGAVARVAARAGCSLVEQGSVAAGVAVFSISCPSRWTTVDLLDELAWEDSREPETRRYARACRFRSLADLLAWVQERVPFVPEEIETFKGWRYTLSHGGDCDDSARLLVALLRSLDVPARLATIGDPPLHVAAQAYSRHRQRDGLDPWAWMDATVQGARPGEHPAEACARLGIPVRPDLAGG